MISRLQPVNYLPIFGVWSFLLLSCTGEQKQLPIYGERETVEKVINGKTVTDTVYHTIGEFTLVNQYGDTVTNKSLEGKVYVADFFFTTCPTICPVMKKQMKKVYEATRADERVAILSHTIDPKHDTPEVLRKFAEDLGITGTKWQFVTGPKKDIYDIGQGSYMVTAKEDSTAEGGYLHSGAFILIDTHRRVRGTYDGTKEADAERLIKDIHQLLKEE